MNSFSKTYNFRKYLTPNLYNNILNPKSISHFYLFIFIFILIKISLAIYYLFLFYSEKDQLAIYFYLPPPFPIISKNHFLDKTLSSKQNLRIANHLVYNG